MPKGLLLAAFDFSTAHADEFHDWYDHEHLPERLRVPGFLSAERWIDETNPMVHVATYDLEAADVLRSAPYLAVGGENQSVWTKRVTGMCQRIMRFEGEQLAPGDAVAPEGAGGLLMASMNVKPDAMADFTEWYNTEHLPQLAAVPGVLSARRYQATDTESERRFVALYHLRDAGVSHSEAWKTAAQTPWSARMQDNFIDLLVLRMHRHRRAG